MTTLIVILHVICCFLLIVVILIQGGRGQGLTGPSFASGNVQSLFGTRAADVLTKATSVAAICFLLTCISLDWIEAQKARSLMGGPQRVAPLDVQKIKEALEKVKAEKAQEAALPAGAAVPAAASASAAAPAPAQAEKAARDVAHSLIPEETPSAPEKTGTTPAQESQTT